MNGLFTFNPGVGGDGHTHHRAAENSILNLEFGSPTMRFTQLCLFLLLLASSVAIQPVQALGQARQPDGKAQDKDSIEPNQVNLSQQETVLRALQKPIDVDWNEKALKEAFVELSQKNNITLRLDQRALDELGLNSDSFLQKKVSLKLTNAPLHSVLDVLLRQYGDYELTYSIHGPVVWITSSEWAHLMTRVYDVADLAVWWKNGKPVTVDIDSLIEMITRMVDPEGWDELGGEGSIVAYLGNGIVTISVSQRTQAHIQIDRLLADLRTISREKGMTAPLPPSFIPSGAGEEAGQPDIRHPVGPPVDVPAEIVASGNRFTCDVFRQLATQEPRGNLIASPYSVYECLGMTYAGAAGTTAKELATVGHFLAHGNELHPAMASMRRRWQQLGRTDGITLRVANRLWVDFDAKVTGNYVRSIANHYDGGLARLDLTNPDESAKRINDWVADETAGHIQNLVGPRDFPWEEVPVIALTNAVCFDGEWDKPFLPSGSYDGTFHTFEGDTPIRMMMHEKTYRFAKHEGTMVLEKPYAGGESSLAMWFLLPQEGRDAFEELQRSLTPVEIDAWSNRLSSQQVELHIPKFKFESRPQLVPVLNTLGLRSLFVQTKADLTGIMDDPSLYIYTVIHAAQIEVDEAGTRASAATLFGGGLGGMAPKMPVFKADRPFVFLIRDRATGAILFIGRFVEPDHQF